jgi:hypothetical protein
VQYWLFVASKSFFLHKEPFWPEKPLAYLRPLPSIRCKFPVKRAVKSIETRRIGHLILQQQKRRPKPPLRPFITPSYLFQSLHDSSASAQNHSRITPRAFLLKAFSYCGCNLKHFEFSVSEFEFEIRIRI